MLSNVSHLIYIVMSPLLSTTFIIMNLITIYIYCKKFKLTTVCVMLIVNICICDIFVCLVSNTLYMINLMHPTYGWSTGALACKLFKFLTMLANVAQIYFLCFLTADRLRRLVYATMRQWRKREGLWFTVTGWTFALVLTSPRVVLFDETIVTKLSVESNQSEILNVKCKPTGMETSSYVGSTLALFVLAYALPATFIVYAAIRTQLFMWKRRRTIHISSNNNFVMKMKNKLSLTFNLTAGFFMLIWTPFFFLSIFDLTMNLLQKKELVHLNFAFRCILLVAGSAKPIIYIICLDKFRSSFTFASSSSTAVLVEVSSKPEPSENLHRNTQETDLSRQTATRSFGQSLQQSSV